MRVIADDVDIDAIARLIAQLGAARLARTYVPGFAGLEQQAEDNALLMMAKLAGD